MDIDITKIFNDKIKSRLEKAFHSSESEKQLVYLVEELKSEGWNQLQVYDVFEEYYKHLNELYFDNEPDVVANVLDCIYGYCRENAKLFGRTMTNEEIYKYRETKNQ